MTVLRDFVDGILDRKWSRARHVNGRNRKPGRARPDDPPAAPLGRAGYGDGKAFTGSKITSVPSLRARQM